MNLVMGFLNNTVNKPVTFPAFAGRQPPYLHYKPITLTSSAEQQIDEQLYLSMNEKYRAIVHHALLVLSAANLFSFSP